MEIGIPKMTMPEVVHFLEMPIQTGIMQIQAYKDDTILLATNCKTNESEMHLMTKAKAKEIGEFLLKAANC